MGCRLRSIHGGHLNLNSVRKPPLIGKPLAICWEILRLDIEIGVDCVDQEVLDVDSPGRVRQQWKTTEQKSMDHMGRTTSLDRYARRWWLGRGEFHSRGWRDRRGSRKSPWGLAGTGRLPSGCRRQSQPSSGSARALGHPMRSTGRRGTAARRRGGELDVRSLSAAAARGRLTGWCTTRSARIRRPVAFCCRCWRSGRRVLGRLSLQASDAGGGCWWGRRWPACDPLLLHIGSCPFYRRLSIAL